MGHMRKSALATVGLAALLGAKSGALGQPDELDVYNPGSVVLGQSFTLEWESIGQNSFDVVLFADSSSCSGSEPVDLCNESDGCGDSKGDLNIVIPVSAGEGERELLLQFPMSWIDHTARSSGWLFDDKIWGVTCVCGGS